MKDDSSGRLSSAAFEKLLDWLDADRERAWEEYSKLRRKLIVYFRRRDHRISAEDFADATFDRIARKLDGGGVIRTTNRAGFCLGVAGRLLMEHYRSPENRREDPDSDATAQQMNRDSVAASLKPDKEEVESEWVKRKVDCLNKCLNELKSKDRHLLVSYFSDEATRGCSRQELAVKLGVSYGNLRRRANYLRAKVEECFNRCLGRDNA